MTNSPFSFHCFICYEEFSAETRYPVVFPCGHTYVCNLCADRLDKCFECRTPLSMTIPRTDAPAAAPGCGHLHATPRPASYAARQRPGFQSIHNRNAAAGSAPACPPPIKKRLPLPKNVVLLSLMEATELAARSVRISEEERQRQEASTADSSSAPGTPVMAASKSLLDPEDEEEEKIKVGTTLAASDCGTYAVADKDGLEIFPIFPSSLASSSFQEETQEDSLMRVYHNKSESATDENSETGSKEHTQPARLRYGDRVQIVSLDNGWAKLARGYGFARADKNRLVKVGGSVDRACKLEALLRRLSTRRKELKADQMRLDNQFISLMNDLQVSLRRDEDLTVITADTFHKKPQSDPNPKMEDVREAPAQPEERDNTTSPIQPAAAELRAALAPQVTPIKPRKVPSRSKSTGYFCAGTDVLETMIPTCSEDEANSQGNSNSSVVSASSPMSQNIRTIGSAEFRRSPLLPASHPSPNALRRGARAWREMHGRQASSSTGIDFRTGLSGHTALLSSSATTHGGSGQEATFASLRGHVFRGMSNHSGLTMSKAARRILSQPLGNLSMPAFSGLGTLTSSPSRQQSIVETPSIAST